MCITYCCKSSDEQSSETHWHQVSLMKHAVFNKKIKLVKIEGKFNPADALTKVISLESFWRHCFTIQVLHEEHR